MDKAKTFSIGDEGAHLKSKSSKFEDKLESEEDGEDDVEGVEESCVQLKYWNILYLHLSRHFVSS